MRKYLRNFDRSSYWSGFISAVILLLFVFGSVLLLFSVRGVTVYISSEDLAGMVRDRVVTQARQDLPGIIANAKAEIPKIVEEEMRDQLTSDRMEIAGFVFRVPDELMNQLRKNMQDNVERATGEILSGIDTTTVAEQFGESIYQMVRQTLHGELDGSSFHIKVFERFPLRVRVSVLD